MSSKKGPVKKSNKNSQEGVGGHGNQHFTTRKDENLKTHDSKKQKKD
jgi:hypothetical protein